MTTSFAFNYRHAHIRHYDQIRQLEPMFESFLDEQFRTRVFDLLKRQLGSYGDNQKIEYTLEITIGDADPDKDGISLRGELLGKTYSQFSLAIPKFIDQVQLKPEVRQQYRYDDYSPEARNLHYLYLLNALGYGHTRLNQQADQASQQWDAEYLSFFTQLIRVQPDLHHHLHDLITDRSVVARRNFFAPVIDPMIIAGLKDMQFPLRAIQECYFKERLAAVFSEPGQGSAVVRLEQDQWNINRLQRLILPSYPVHFDLTGWWHELQDHEDKPLDRLQKEYQSTKFLVEFHREYFQPFFTQFKQQPEYLDITNILLGTDAEEETGPVTT